MTNAAELQQVATEKKAGSFEVLDSYERLIELRETSPDEFMLQTSTATRYALAHYERAKAQAGAGGGEDEQGQ